jgi:hypothetical protein
MNTRDILFKDKPLQPVTEGAYAISFADCNAHAAARDSSEPSGIVPVWALRVDLAIHAVYSLASPRHHVRILRYASSWQAGA